MDLKQPITLKRRLHFRNNTHQHVSLATFILEDIVYISFQPNLNYFLASLGLQKTPSIQSKQSSLTKQSYYYDFDYNICSSDAKLTIGSRFFSGSTDAYGQFIAPFSSGHSWDGYSNIFQPNIIHGFSEDFRSFKLSFQTQASLNKALVFMVIYLGMAP